MLLYRRRSRRMRGKRGHSVNGPEPGIQNNPAYETNGDQISNDSGCPDVSTDDIGDNEYNSISLKAMNDYQNPHGDATYNHITFGPTKAIETDNTYAHIPNTKAAVFDNTYSHMSNQNTRPEHDPNMETDDSTYNHLGEPTALAAVTHRTDNEHLSVKSNNGLTDDTYSHINANSNGVQNQKLRADYEDTTYNHLGDIPTSTSAARGLFYGQQSKIGQNTNGVIEQSNANQKAVAGRYNYAVVNKHHKAAKPAFHDDDAAHNYFVLEPDNETTTTPKPYVYAVVNKMPYASETASPSDNGPHTDGTNKRFALVPNKSKATQPKPYDYAVVNKMSLAPEAALSPEDGPHEYYVLEPTQSKTAKP